MKLFKQNYIVKPSDTAIVHGSGSLEVYATPAMVALMENSATKVIDNLEEGFTTVGIAIDVQHLKASKVGEVLSCTAKLTKNEGRRYEFEIVVENEKAEIVGKANHTRVAVNIERFLS